MNVLDPPAYDAEEEQLREQIKYTAMDRLILPAEFQQPPVSTGVSLSFSFSIKYISLH